MPSEIYHDAEVFRAIEDACSRKPDLPQLFDIAKGYPTDPRVHSAVFVAFAEMSCDRDLVPNRNIQSEIGESGALTYIIEGVRGFMDREEVVASAFWALCNLVFRHAENAKLAKQLSSVEVVVQGMQRHIQSAQVQDRGASAIFSLAWTDPEAQTAAADIGAVDTLVDAMSRHMTHPGCIEHTALALCSLSANHEANQAEVFRLSLPLVMKAMRAHRETPKVQDACVRLLHNLIWKKEDNGVAICRAGGVLAIMDAMTTHHKEEVLQDRCRSLLRHIDEAGVQQRQVEWIMAELAAERERLTELMAEVQVERRRVCGHCGMANF